MDLQKKKLTDQSIVCSDKNGNYPTLEESIALATNAFEKTLETNKIDHAIEMLEPFADRSLYHSSLLSLFIIFKAGFSLREEDLEKALKSTDQTAKLSDKYRDNGFFNNLIKFFKTPNYNKYTDMQIHAELTYAKFLALSAVLLALEAQNIYSLIKIVYRLRLCVNAFKKCRTIFKTRTEWESETSRLHFEAGIRLAHGLQHLFISHIPEKLLKLVNFIGYKGIESIGFEELNKTAFELPGISSKLAQIILLLYGIIGQPHACLGPKDLTFSQQFNDDELKKYPNSLLYRFTKAKLEQISGRIDESIITFNNCLVENSLEIAHKLFHFELIFCYALQCQWSECIKYAELVRQTTDKHSATVCTYIEAVFRYTKSVDENDLQMKRMASQLFESIPAMRIRYFGKTKTIEKIAVENSITYFKNNESLILPELGALYHGNYFYFINNNKTLLNKHLERVSKFVDLYERDFNNSNSVDNYLSALFYKGVLLRHLGNFKQAKECLNIVLKEESRIKHELSIAPQTVLELGLAELFESNFETAKMWLDKVINDYSGYLTENSVHLKAYAALRELGFSTDKQDASKFKLDEYGKEWLQDLGVEENRYEDMLKIDRLVLK